MLDDRTHLPYSFSTSKLEMIVNGSVSVWDFMSDTKASWAVPLSGDFDRVSVHAMSNNHLLWIIIDICSRLFSRMPSLYYAIKILYLFGISRIYILVEAV